MSSKLNVVFRSIFEEKKFLHVSLFFVHEL